jgi:hypothetical protein
MDEIMEQLERTEWEYAVTLTFTDKALRSLTNDRQADPSLIAYRDFVRKVAAATKLRVCAVSVAVWDSPEIRNHIHLLMAGRSTKTGRTLADVPTVQMEGCWVHGNAKVTHVTSNGNAIRYLAKNQREGGTGYNMHGQRLMNRLTSNHSAAA